MTLETLNQLEDQTIAKLKDLTRINIDSAAGFKEAADVVENDQLKVLFTSLSQQRGHFAQELNRHIMLDEQDTEITSSWKGMFHRWWMDLRGKLSGGDAYAVLAEAERGEDAIKQMYEDVIKQTVGSPLNDVLLAQYAEIKRGHDKVRDLRDAVKDS